ncbi:hypothetical protein [Aneurinibacillus terranovensis]|uniref:hypothetical protein n=1 Tax=Aneurinibacillus terranovensis TaxID=278991 RepID=UPI0003F9BB3F|nr:hypothetical protein [Aneurinibacillus terranovensis]
MAKKSVLIVFILTASLGLLSCNQNRLVPAEAEQASQPVMEAIFYHHYSVSLFQFGKIMNKLSLVTHQQDLPYIKGMVDAYDDTNPLFISALIVNDKETFNKIVPKDLQEEVIALFNNQKAYISYVETLLEQKDTAKIKKNAGEFANVYKLERELNDNRLRNREDLSDYKKSLLQMNKILSKYANH